MENVFFSNSGAEANETAIKIARRHASLHGIANPSILVMENSFHGRTLATLAATGNRKAQSGFEPLVQGFIRVPFGDIGAVSRAAQYCSEIVAILVEPVQGEAGVVVPEPGYLAGLRQICDENEWLLMLDEVQTGLGRTGRLFAFEHDCIQPDVITLAKALGNGFPIGACLARAGAARALQPGSHGSTFGGNPLACTVASKVVETIVGEDLANRANRLGSELATELHNLCCTLPGFREVRSLGLMIGIEFDHDCTQLPLVALNHGLLINVTASRVVRLLPPLILNDEQMQLLLFKLGDTLTSFHDT